MTRNAHDATHRAWASQLVEALGVGLAVWGLQSVWGLALWLRCFDRISARQHRGDTEFSGSCTSEALVSLPESELQTRADYPKAPK